MSARFPLSVLLSRRQMQITLDKRTQTHARNIAGDALIRGTISFSAELSQRNSFADVIPPPNTTIINDVNNASSYVTVITICYARSLLCNIYYVFRVLHRPMVNNCTCQHCPSSCMNRIPSVCNESQSFIYLYIVYLFVYRDMIICRCSISCTIHKRWDNTIGQKQNTISHNSLLYW